MNFSQTNHMDGLAFESLVKNGAATLKKHVSEVNDLNVFPIPDGDTGDNMYRTITGGVAAMANVTDNSVSKKSKALADGMLLNARGNSGVILSQLFSGLAEGFDGIDVADMSSIIAALRQGVKKGYASVVTPVEGTILTVAREATEQVASVTNNDTSLKDFADSFISAVSVSLENTPELLAVLKEAGVVDSGGAGLLYLAEGARQAILGNSEDEVAATYATTQKDLDFNKFTEDSVMEFGYCTEFLLRLQTAKTDVEKFDVNVIIDYLGTIGDSIVAFKTGSIVKVHVHTLMPYKALEFAQKFGEFLTVKIENMTLQHNEVVAHDHENDSEITLPKVKRARKKYGLCAVADGEGVINLFCELGADVVIEGGQSKNPAISDFIEAFNQINADNIFILPNNPNIFMAAEQAGDMYDNSKIYVIPTKNVGQAYSALSMLDYTADDADAIAGQLESDMAEVVTGMVSRCVRDASLNGVDVKTDDYVGFTDKTMLVSASTKEATALMLAEKLGLANMSFLTVFYGSDVSPKEQSAFGKLIKEKYPRIEFYEIEGKQDIYEFILIME